MDAFKKKFIEEANDLINELEKTLLDLEKKPNDKTLTEKIFRAMHSLKGGSSMFGFSKMDNFTHHLETMYDLLRNNKLKFSLELLDITFTSIDHLKKLVSTGNEQDESFNTENEKLIKRIISSCTTNAATSPDAIENEQTISNNIQRNERTNLYYIYFQPDEDILKSGSNPMYIVEEIFQLGKCKIFPRTNRIPEIDTLEVTKNYIYWELFLATTADKGIIKDIFIFVEDHCKLEIEIISDIDLFENNDFVQNLEKLSLKDDKFNLEEIKQSAKISGQKLKTEEFSISLKEKKAKIKKESNQITSIRVSSDKLDMLMNFVSELVTTQARLSLYAEHSNSAELISIAENIEKISRNLRDNAFSICLIPLESVLTRFQRLVRDLSADMNKDVSFEIEGAETELDKSIIENITDPIMHILRNSLDHGIEAAEERKRLNKPKQGKILLKAFYSGANVIIKISDDGAGIDTDVIRKQALKRNLITAESNYNDKEILDLIFLPGFSTSENITNVSGRGVGLDVVKRKISDISGEVSIETKMNVGTNITITLPLTLSIIDGLLVLIDSIHYVIPLSSVDKCFEFKHEQLINAVNNMIFVNDGHIPFVYLREEFKCTSVPKTIEQVVVVTYNDLRIGLAVDHVIGEYQAVIKSLGKAFKKQDIISGATILGDGTVALVVDPNKIILHATNKLTEVVQPALNGH